MAPHCGIPAETIREVARAYATSKGSMILWGMGISQHVHGTDNARCLIALTLMTGQIGKPGSGLHPLRGQNNVQGASDMQGQHNALPVGLQRVLQQVPWLLRFKRITQCLQLCVGGSCSRLLCVFHPSYPSTFSTRILKCLASGSNGPSSRILCPSFRKLIGTLRMGSPASSQTSSCSPLSIISNFNFVFT